MNRENIIKLAKESGFYIKDNEIYSMSNQSDLGFLLGDNWMMHHEFEYFAKLVAEHERNEIIEILDASTGYVQMDLIRERT